MRVGRTPIDKRTVDHWTAVIARGAPVPNLSGSEHSTPRQRALAFLIASNQLIGEAAAQGLHLSEAQVARRVREQWESTPSGHAEFESALKASGETLADIELETKAQWATSAVGELVSRRVDSLARARVTAAAVLSYYHRHIAQFRYSERRDYEIIENLPTAAAARALGRRIGPGKRFHQMGIPESYARIPSNFAEDEGKAPVMRAIFAAKPGVISRPMILHRHYVLFVVRRIKPAGLQAFTAVRGKIESRLLEQSRRRLLGSMVTEYRAKWLAQTECRPGYVVQKCRQYTGARAPESAPFAGG